MTYQRLEKARIEGGGEHPPAAAHLYREPLGDAAPSGRDLEARLSRCYTDSL